MEKANVVPVHKKEDKMLVKIIALLAQFLFLENREQGVVFNGQTSERRKIMSGNPQGSVLGLFCF